MCLPVSKINWSREGTVTSSSELNREASKPSCQLCDRGSKDTTLKLHDAKEKNEQTQG